MAGSGKLIAIEGTDGSGKTVQFERLVLALPESVRVATLDFPRYGDPAAHFAEKYLTGKYGGETGPYAAAVLFAVDRFDAKLKIEEWLREGRLVVANRYAASNMAHQGAKIAEKKEREHFYRWLRELEYELFGVPRPDLSILLHVPAAIAEKDFDYEKRVEEAYREIAALFPEELRVIECAHAGKLLPPEAIHERVLAAARKIVGF